LRERRVEQNPLPHKRRADLHLRPGRRLEMPTIMRKPI
jgi:hypothetical protein